jgi:hypothetical protein
MGGMIGDLISSGERIRGNPPLKDGHDQINYQAFQLIRVFGTHRESFEPMNHAESLSIPTQSSAYWHHSAQPMSSLGFRTRCLHLGQVNAGSSLKNSMSFLQCGQITS